MDLKIYQVDAFAEKTFQGNPAAVCPLDEWLPSSTMQLIALENNLSETAFFVQEGQDYRIRWFTPASEVDLCGHATLASAHVLFKHLGLADKTIRFHSRSGILEVQQEGEAYTLNFPTDQLTQEDTSAWIKEILGGKPVEVWRGKDDLLIILATEQEVKNLSPDFAKMKTIPTRGVIASAPGEKVDFISRCFFPNVGINEDPVTGSAHTTMIPYWSRRLQKTELTARQISARGGNLLCQMLGARVKISGTCVTFLEGRISIT